MRSSHKLVSRLLAAYQGSLAERWLVSCEDETSQNTQDETKRGYNATEACNRYLLGIYLRKFSHIIVGPYLACDQAFFFSKQGEGEKKNAFLIGDVIGYLT